MCFTNLSINHNFFLTSLFCAQVGVTWLKNNLKRFFILMIPDRKWKFNVIFFLCLLWINCSRSYPGLHEILTKLKASIERGCVNLQVPLISDLHPRKVCKALPSYDSSNFFSNEHLKWAVSFCERMSLLMVFHSQRLCWSSLHVPFDSIL